MVLLDAYVEPEEPSEVVKGSQSYDGAEEEHDRSDYIDVCHLDAGGISIAKDESRQDVFRERVVREVRRNNCSNLCTTDEYVPKLKANLAQSMN